MSENPLGEAGGAEWSRCPENDTNGDPVATARGTVRRARRRYRPRRFRAPQVDSDVRSGRLYGVRRLNAVIDRV